MELLFENQTKLRVRYGETDQMGYCYYGNYAQYFEVGRVEAMRSVGMSYREMEARGIMLPVSDFSVKYHAPARYDDELTITTSIVAVKGARLLFDYVIHNEQGELVAKAHTTLVFVTVSTMRPTKAPEDFLEMLKPYSK
ncbi:acyl-CoA thioesterase [Crocinitomicaceae bacterium CZZ-1]|uniref:Acyl-CoA thioesterase n=1 Tax=Taishania pollutisoli TaxID=2766479 RepID=A0A8J6PAS2_9FLAO|nr:thioesterase family protein [Taishania pollutisoli]MBC9813561.1 acyl-CoA thioesterase [Taishania pollutisoli]MBX2949069.1 acyl-CoA thioesterase [Crocinitomicaceae bacterium]NGF76001.1 acyl-CoA thioesterase [Fluviicola sp. SGL-29]